MTMLTREEMKQLLEKIAAHADAVIRYFAYSHHAQSRLSAAACARSASHRPTTHPLANRHARKATNAAAAVDGWEPDPQ